MTNEEAIRYFKRHIDLYCVDGISREAEEMAIKALEQQPCDDAISREDVEECKELMTDINGDTVYAVRMSDIRQLPPVTPQQKYGKWINKDRYYHDTITAECSECCREVEIPTCMEELMYDFCPYCGAKMESEDKE